MPPKSMYNDAQWVWLFDRFTEGYTMKELAKFARCGTDNFVYHWHRLGLRLEKSERYPLSRKEFDALGGFGNG